MYKRVSTFILAAVIAVSIAVPVAGDELSSAKSQKSSVDNKLNSIEQQKASEKNKLESLQKEKAALADSEKKAESEYKLTESDLKVIRAQMEAIEAACDEAEADYSKQLETFKKRVRVMYQNSNASYINTLAQSENMSEFFSRAQVFSTIAKKDKELVGTLDALKQDVEFKRKLKEDEKRQQERLLSDKQRALTSIKASRSKKEEEEKKISATLKILDQQEDELIKKSEELSNTINNLNNRRKGGYVNGEMVWPTPGYGTVTSYYGYRIHPVLKTKKFHTGIDIGAPSGAAIVSANKGTVIYAGWQSGYGNTVIVDHGGDIVTLYAHASKIMVSTGAEVEAGAVVAKVGSTGMSTGPHLHFEVRKGGSTVNPLGYFGQ